MDQTISSPSPEAVVTPTTLPSSKVLFKEVLATYKLLWKKLFLISLIPGIINVIVFYVGIFLENGSFSTMSEWVLWGSLIATTLVSMIVFLLAQLAMVSIVSNAHNNITDTVSSSFKNSFSMFWSFVLLVLLTTLIVMGGYIALIIPGILFAFYTSFATIVLVDEKQKGYDALAKSYVVMKGKFWQVVTTMLKVVFRSLVFIIPFFLLSIGATFFGNYLDFGSFTPNSPVVQNGVVVGQVFDGPYTTAISQILNMLLSALWFPFLFILNYRVFAYLRFIKGNITPEETQKAKKTLKIFTALGVVVFVGLVLFFWYAFSTGMFTR